MRIEYRRSGGMAGIDMTASVDTRKLPAAQAQLAADLMDPTSAASAPTTGVGAPDRFSYELTVHDGEQAQTHNWSETEVPAVVQPLLASLGQRAQPAPPG